MIRPSAIPLVLLVSGCFVLDRPPQLQVLCAADADCPTGLVCAHGPEADGCCVAPETAAVLGGGNPDGLVCRQWCADPRLKPTGAAACRPSFSMLAAADESTCGLLTVDAGLKGAVYCWGAAQDTVTAWYRSLTPPPPLSKIVARKDILCGLEAPEGALQCWRLSSATPDGLLLDDARKAGYNDLAMTSDHVCGLTADGVAVCLPLPGATSVPVPLERPPKWKSLAPGTPYDCALDTDGAIACWPTVPEGLLATSADLLARSGTVGCLVKEGDLHCWAETDAGKPLAQAVQPEAGVAVAAVAVGDELVCALSAAEALRPPACWAPAALDVPEVTGLSSLVVGKAHACALKADASAVCWGANDAGQAPRTFPAAP
ncbi:MAG: hypothetical protein RL199_86 [Pseudomonadota bacterium]|jgi:hypothetical protein